MKITWITNNINICGGIERVVTGMANEFARRDIDVEIISRHTTETKPFFEIAPAVAIKHLGVDWRVDTQTYGIREAGRLLKTLDSDFVIGCHAPTNVALALNHRVFHGKVIVTQHRACDSLSAKRLRINALTYRFADASLMLTESDKSIYEHMGLKNCVVMPNACFEPFPDNSHPANNKRIIAVGRTTPDKGFDLLIRAFALFYKNHPDWSLRILGNGEQLEALKSLVRELNVSENVELPGFSDRVFDELKDADFFVSSSRSEGFMLALVEAMTAGLPVVAFDIPAIREIVGDDGCILIPGFEPTALAAGMERMITPDCSETYRKRSRRIAEAYNTQQIGDRWLNLFERLNGRK